MGGDSRPFVIGPEIDADATVIVSHRSGCSFIRAALSYKLPLDSELSRKSLSFTGD